MNTQNYQIDPSPIGAGAEGEVFRAVDLKNTQLVAIKVIEDKTSFLNQTAILSHVSIHVNIVSLIDYFDEPTMNYLVMEYYPMTLRDYLDCFNNTAMPRRLLKTFAYQIANGLDFIHANGYVHLDLKPENILFCPRQSKLAITDFGLSEMIVDTPLSHYNVQTLNYRAPEVLKRELYSFPADVWSFGCIVYEIATGGQTLFPFVNYRSDSPKKFEDCVVSIITLLKDPRLEKLSPLLKRDTDMFIRWILDMHQETRPTCLQILNDEFLKIQ